MVNVSKSFNPELLSDIIELEETGDPGLLASLVSEFIANVPVLLQELETAITASDYKTLERAAHTLKSSSRLLGLETSAEIALEIEDEASQQRFSPDKLIHLKQNLEIGRNELRKYNELRSLPKPVT